MFFICVCVCVCVCVCCVCVCVCVCMRVVVFLVFCFLFFFGFFLFLLFLFHQKGSSGDCTFFFPPTCEGFWSLLPAVTGYRLVSGSHDKQLRVWDIQSCECIRTLRGHTDTVSAVKLKVGPPQPAVS